MRRILSFVAVVGVVLSCSALASAFELEVQVKFIEVDPSNQVDLTHPLVGTSPFAAGVYKIEVDFDDGKGPQPFDAFCIDLKQVTSGYFRPYTVTDQIRNAPLDGGTPYSPMGIAKANAIRELWGEHFDEIGNDGLKAAAFQAALWEIIYENLPNVTPNAWDVSSGNLLLEDTTHATIIATANAWLGTIGDAEQTLNADLLALTNYTDADRYQDYLFDGGPGREIPEPLTMASVLLGICGLGSYVRRRTAV